MFSVCWVSVDCAFLVYTLCYAGCYLCWLLVCAGCDCDKWWFWLPDSAAVVLGLHCVIVAGVLGISWCVLGYRFGGVDLGYVCRFACGWCMLWFGVGV